MRLCFLVQSHLPAAGTVRLVHTLKASAPDAFVLIQHDPSTHQLTPAHVADLDDVAVHVRPANRGNISVVDGYLEAVAWLRTEGVAYDWLANLSGQCYPARPLAELAAELDASQADAWFRHQRAFEQVDGWRPDEGVERYGFHHRIRVAGVSRATHELLRPVQWVLHRTQPWVRLQTSIGASVGIRTKRHPFTESWPCWAYGGSWFRVVRRPAAERVAEVVAARPELREHYRRTWAPDESMLQTVLLNTPGFTVADRSPWYIDWSIDNHGRPVTLSLDDLPAIVASGAYFARKVDPQQPALLDALDRQVL